MNTDKNRIDAEFGPEAGFELTPAYGGTAFKNDQENRFEVLKRGLLNDRLSDIWETEANTSARRAANDAASLAWTTPFPLLAFPELFEEKLRAYLAQSERQTEITQRSRELLAV